MSRLITSIETRNFRFFTFVFSVKGMISVWYDFGCSSVSTNFVKHSTRFHWIIKRKPKIHVLTRGWVMQFPNLALGVGQSFLCRREGVGHAFFINHISKCSGPPPLPPPPILFDQSLTCMTEISYFLHKLLAEINLR